MAGLAHEMGKPAPFDTAHLDTLLDDHGIDVLVATSKHNIQYLPVSYTHLRAHET